MARNRRIEVGVFLDLAWQSDVMVAVHSETVLELQPSHLNPLKSHIFMLVNTIISSLMLL